MESVHVEKSFSTASCIGEYTFCSTYSHIYIMMNSSFDDLPKMLENLYPGYTVFILMHLLAQTLSGLWWSLVVLQSGLSLKKFTGLYSHWKFNHVLDFFEKCIS